jgi:hypothetical protein
MAGDNIFDPRGGADRLLRVLGLVETPEEFEVFADGMLNLALITRCEFERRFPVEFARWDARLDAEAREGGE